jgi:hypothetical protein
MRYYISLPSKMRFKISSLMFTIYLFWAPSLLSQGITNYLPFTGWGICNDKSEEVIILRKFFKDNHFYFFTLSPGSLNTGIVRADNIKVFAGSWKTIRTRYAATPYILALQQAETSSDKLQDAGFTRFDSSHKGIELTVDLCPSQRPLDRIVFTDLIKEMEGIEKPVPLGVSITGLWIKEHPDDLSWLNGLAKSGLLSITWINHSFNHYVRKNVPLKMNFLLAPGTDINSEVLDTEIEMLGKGIMPSLFFRFPGLVSDHEIYEQILKLGLIPIGSDSWLAKGQWPDTGSVVLIHANGNEPLGVNDFIKLLKTKRSEALNNRWELYDLRESLVKEESK